jgi:glucose-1-phosphate adenylyltransferase
MALVLSGGGGERMGVLSAERAVSAIPFGGKYRIIDFALSNCCHSEIVHIGVLTQHAPTSLHDHIGAGRPWDLDRRGGGVMVLQPYLTRSNSGWYRGTADAIAQNLDSIDERGGDRILVLAGDHVYRMDYRALVQTHEQQRAAVTLAVTPVPRDQTRRFGMVTVDGEGRVTRLDEKPASSETPLASMGIYLFESDVMREALRGRPVDLVLDVLRPLLDSGVRIAAHAFSGYWEDVGTIGSYYRANLELVAPEPRLVMHDRRWPILTRDEERPPALLLEGADVEDSVIANGCRIAGRVRRSVIFPGVSIGPGCEIVDSIVLPDVIVERGARLAGAILDKYVRVGEGARVGRAALDDPSAPAPSASDGWLEGLTLVGKDAVLPPGLRVGPGAVIGHGALPEDFGEGEVGAGALTPNRTWYGDRT